MERQMDGGKYYISTKGIWTRGLRPHALRVITVCENDHQKAMRTTGLLGCRGNRTNEVQTLQWTYQKDQVSTYLRWPRGHLDCRTHPSELQQSLCRATYLRWPQGHLDRRTYLSEVYARKAYAEHMPYHASGIVQVVKIHHVSGIVQIVEIWKLYELPLAITSFIFI